MPIRALTFDVFGTVVDWRSSVAAELERFFNPRGITRDWTALALQWRALYQPAMQAVRSGTRDYVVLDQLHRENLLRLLPQYRLDALTDAETQHVTQAWHRLDPWPDVVAALHALKPHYVLATLSNGNVALMVNMARRAALPWDAILGAEFAQQYKPEPVVYLKTAAALGLGPAECMMVAAHNDDLRVAASLGFRTAYVNRPTEYGPAQQQDLAPEEDWDICCDTFTELAAVLLEPGAASDLTH